MTDHASPDDIDKLTPRSRQILVAIGIAVVALLILLGYLGLSRYRSHRFYQACITGSEQILKDRGYRECEARASADSAVFCDPRQDYSAALPQRSDRCEYRRVGRRLVIRFEPANR